MHVSHSLCTAAPPLNDFFEGRGGCTQASVTEIHEPYKKQKQKQNKKRARLHARKGRPGTNFPKIVKYKSPSGSKLNNSTG